MKWLPRNYVQSVIPMITTYALIGHGVFHYPAGKPRIRFSMLYAIFWSIGYAILLHYTISYALIHSHDTNQLKPFIYSSYMHTFVINCSAAVSWYHYKRTGRIVERITAIDETLRELGADCRYKCTFRWTVGVIAGQIILIIINNSIDMIWMKNNMNFLETAWFNIVVHYPFNVSSIGLLNFSMAMRTIIMRFAITNKILETIADRRCRIWYTVAFVRQKNCRVRPCNSNFLEHCPAPRDYCRKNLVLIIKQVHLELCGISRDLIKTYGVQMILQFAEYLVLLTALLYDLYLNLMNTDQLRRGLQINILYIWIIIYFGKIAIVNYLCDKAVVEANRTRDIIHKSNALYEDTGFKDDISQFALQMMQNPLSFSPVGFFTMNNKFIRTMIGTVTTYVVVLIQMKAVSKL